MRVFGCWMLYSRRRESVSLSDGKLHRELYVPFLAAFSFATICGGCIDLVPSSCCKHPPDNILTGYPASRFKYKKRFLSFSLPLSDAFEATKIRRTCLYLDLALQCIVLIFRPQYYTTIARHVGHTYRSISI